MKKLILALALFTTVNLSAQTIDTTEFKTSGSSVQLKKTYKVTYIDSLNLDSAKTMIYLKQFESEFNEIVVQITTIQKELEAKKLQRQSKRGQHNRLLNVAKNKWAITKNPL